MMYYAVGMALFAPQRNPIVTRVTHWGTALSFVLLFGTGAAIFDHRPAFRVGNARFELPRIPSWLTISSSPKILHYAFAALFVLCGIWYVAWGVRSGHFKALIPGRADLSNLLPMQLYYLRLRAQPPPYERYNPLQKAAYSLVLFVITPLIVLSGAAMLPVRQLQVIGGVFPGGTKLWHFGLMSALTLFVAGHLVMVMSTGLSKNFRRMV